MSELLDESSLSSSGPSCTDTNCALLPFGFFLLVVDSYFDLRYVFQPSPRTARELQAYYTFILTPTWRPFPRPGFWYPIYVIFKLCIQCSTIYNWGLLALFLPISYKYRQLLAGQTARALQNWWIIVVLRIGLAIVNTLAVRIHGACGVDHVVNFWMAHPLAGVQQLALLFTR